MNDGMKCYILNKIQPQEYKQSQLIMRVIQNPLKQHHKNPFKAKEERAPLS